MTNRGLFGLPQGQRSGSGAVLGRPAWTQGVSNAGNDPVSMTFFDSYPTLGTSIVGSFPNNTFQELIASAPYDMVITSVVIYGFATSSNFTLAVGAAGSEVQREPGHFGFANGTHIHTILPYPVPVRQGERLAISFGRSALTSGTLRMYVNAVRMNRLPAIGEVAGVGAQTGNSGWAQIATTTPLSGGKGGWIYAIAATPNHGLSTPQQFRLGFGAAGSEQPITTGYTAGTVSDANSATGLIYIPPIWWPSGVRLAVQPNFSNRDTNVVVFVRDVLP